MRDDFEDGGDGAMLFNLVRVLVVVAVVAMGAWIGYRAGVDDGTAHALASWRCPPPAEPCQSCPSPEPAAKPAPQVCRWDAADVRHVYRRGWETGYGTGREDWRCLPWEPR